MTQQPLPKTMLAAALNRFGGIEELVIQSVPVPRIGPEEVLIQVEAAGLGSWEPGEREGRYSDYLGKPEFPYVLGWEGAGIVAAVGERVDRLRLGDRVYAVVFPRKGGNGGGFYAQYARAHADEVSLVPGALTFEEAAVMGWDALTALAGIENTLQLRRGESLMIFGASGGVGHFAIQLAKRIGSSVFAVASGADGVALSKRLGADVAVDGRQADVLAEARKFADGLDAALLTAGGSAAENALLAMRDGGRVAYPNGVKPKPGLRSGVTTQSFDAIRGASAIERLHRLIGTGPFEVHVSKAFSLHDIAEAHRALEAHHLGKLALRLT